MTVTARNRLSELERLHRQIEEFAATSRWEDLEALMAERNDLLSGFVADERRRALEAAKKSTDRILELARKARLELVGELADLQRGRAATDVYCANQG